MSLNVIQFPGRIPQWTFAERARKVRRDLRMTQQQRADELHVGLKRYSAWESGKNTPDDLAGIAVSFEKVSGVPRTWFLGWNDENPRPDGPGGDDVRPLGFEPRTHWIRDNRVAHVDFTTRRAVAA